MSELIYRPLRYRDRWFAYLDLLGFTNLVTSNAIENVMPVYSEVLTQMRQACKPGKDNVGLLNSWFSDTFIIYSRSDSLQDFEHVEGATRIFFQLLLMKNIPVRGCISHGKLYSQARRNVFIGPALIEAHLYGEALDWVGYCLAPSVEKTFRKNLPLEYQVHYRKMSDRTILRKAPVEYLYAYAFNSGTANGENPYREALESMKKTAPQKAIQKYAHTIDFLDSSV